MRVERHARNPRGRPSVRDVPDDRVPGRGKLHADLVAPARFERHLDERRVGKTFDDPVAQRSVAAFALFRDDLDLEALRVLDEPVRQASSIGLDPSLGEGEIDALRSPRLELILQRHGRGVVPGEHDQARGETVDAVHDVEHRLLVPALAKRREEQFLEGVARRRGGRHGQYARVLVDDDQVVVFVDDAPSFAASGSRRHRAVVAPGLRGDHEAVLRDDALVGAGHDATVAGDAAGSDQPLGLGVGYTQPLVHHALHRAARVAFGRFDRAHRPCHPRLPGGRYQRPRVSNDVFDPSSTTRSPSRNV